MEVVADRHVGRGCRDVVAVKVLIFLISFGSGCNFWNDLIDFNKCLRVFLFLHIFHAEIVP